MSDHSTTFGIDPAVGHPERLLALGYAPRAARPGTAALFALDATLARIVRGAREPLAAQMRLTWWHHALEALAAGSAPGNPILTALCAEVLPRGVPGATLAVMVEAWEGLLEDSPEHDVAARRRGAQLFAAAATVAEATGDPVCAAGEGWGLADAALHASDAERPALRSAALASLEVPAATRWSPAGRGLGALAKIAWWDLRGERRAGAPSRVARLAWHRLTGG